MQLHIRSTFALFLALTVGIVVLLDGCASPTGSSDQSTDLPRNGGVSAGAARNAQQLNIYVANALSNSVTVYSPTGGQLVRRISQGVLAPRALAFDSFNDLYVLNSRQRRPPVHAGVTVYPPGRNTPERTLVDRISDPASLVIGPNNRVYVGNIGSHSHRGVRIFAAKTGNFIAAIRDGIDDPGFIYAMAFGKTGTLFVGAYSPMGQWAVLAYSPHTLTQLQTLNQGQPPSALAIDASNDLFVGENKAIVEYAPGASSPIRTITQGVGSLTSMAFDAAGNLYVANFGYKSSGYSDAAISVYASDGTLLRSITNGIDQPLSLTVDSAGTLYVANWGSNTVTVYPNGALTPSITISTSVKGPDAIALGP